MKKWILLLVFVLLLTGCSANKEDNVKDQAEEGHEVTISAEDYEILAVNLKIPWSMNKVQDTFFITERTGSIVKVDEKSQVRQKVELKKPLSTAAEAGLLGFVLAPDYSESSKAFAYYTYEDDGQYNRIVTLKLENNTWHEEDLLLDRIPSGQYHHGGRLKIGADSKLYATTGDAAAHPEIAQDIDSLGGKILRLNLDGSVPDDNPFRDSYVFSYGHRNPQGLTWDKDGTLYASEHGSSAHDEINLIEKGQNYGWPVIQGNQQKERMETPLFHSGANLTWAPSGMAFYNGKLYVATLRGNAVREFDLKTRKTREVVKGLGRIRDVFIEEGKLYFVSNNTDGRGNPDQDDDKLYVIELEEL